MHGQQVVSLSDSNLRNSTSRVIH